MNHIERINQLCLLQIDFKVAAEQLAKTYAAAEKLSIPATCSKLRLAQEKLSEANIFLFTAINHLVEIITAQDRE